jgi:hypothetical protein
VYQKDIPVYVLQVKILCLQVNSTPLHYAASAGRAEAIEILINEGVYVSITNKVDRAIWLLALSYSFDAALMSCRRIGPHSILLSPKDT